MISSKLTLPKLASHTVQAVHLMEIETSLNLISWVDSDNVIFVSR
jgi:hypothetical protein